VEHNLDQELPAMGRFDAIIFSFAIRHVSHDRKGARYAEVFDALLPGGVLAISST
jgi:SAM-dependent methyltransferase